MDQVFGPRGMVSSERLKELSEKSDLRGWMQVVSHLGAIALTGWGIHATLGTAWVALPFFAHGVLLNYLYAGQHEFSHSTVFKSPGLNEFFGRLFGFITLHPRDRDQIQHFAHHRYTQKWREDGELYRPTYTLRSYLIGLTGFWLVRRFPGMIIGAAFGGPTEPYVRGKNRDKVILEARVTLALWVAIIAASVAFRSWAVLLYWIGPLAVTKWAHQIQNLIEHVGMPHDANIFENTRSTRTNAFMRWMCWNMQYHTAHHAYPSVPFYRLKDLHHDAFTANGLKPATMTYLGFQIAVIKALRDKPEAEHPDDKVWVGEGLTRTAPAANAPIADKTAA
ncbi:fatty acid desaturase [Phenylobacterium sp.]|uniref:fatty acid desaturase n=1 Tax=Phenylobacterium sp. TaxID=1871053 RepID=UPI0035AE20AB